MLRKIKGLPVPVAVIIMVICVLVGVALGNANALRAASKGTLEAQAAVRQYSDARAVQAGNMLVLARRIAADSPVTASLEQAIEAHRRAGPIAGVAAANAQLTDAVRDARGVLEPLAVETDRRLLTGVVDDFDSGTHLLSRKIGEYNESVQKVRQTLAALPFQFLLQGAVPEVYP